MDDFLRIITSKMKQKIAIQNQQTFLVNIIIRLIHQDMWYRIS